MVKTSTLFSVLLFLFSFHSFSQTITGTITDEAGLPLPGAAVVVKEQPGVGASADVNGNYVLNDVKPGKITLVFSFIGYQAKEVPVDIGASGSRKVDVKMVESDSELDEVVIVGYGVQRRSELSGSIVKLDSKDITDMPAPSFENAIQGKAAGVQIITGSGLAGSGSVVRIRGNASISASGDPLYVVDNIPITQDYFINGNSGGMNTNPLATINPNDIESVEILKDASATAIYGSRGANGVILITTKRGKKGGLRFGFNTRVGLSQPTRMPDMLTGPEYLQLYEEAWVNDGNVGTPTFAFAPSLSWEEAQQNNTNWVDQTIGTGVKQFYDFNVQKGAEKYNFYVGGSYDRNESYLLNNSYTRLSGRINGDYRFSEKLKIGISTSLSQGDNQRVDAAWSGGLGAAMSTALPIYPIYYDRDVYEADPNSPGDSILAHQQGDYWLEAGIGNNPVAFADKKEWRVREVRSINSLNVLYAPTKRISFNVTGSYDYMKQTEDLYLGKELHGFSEIPNGIAIRTPRKIHNWNSFATGSYEFDLGKKHNLTALIGAEYQQSQNQLSARKLTNDEGRVEAVNYVLGVDEALYESGKSVDFDTTFLEADKRFNFLSYFVRLNYNYQKKYFIQGVMRTDGSSKFGPNKRYGYFPSIGVHWLVSNEEFFKKYQNLSYLKIKASYGYVGSAGIPPNRYRSVYFNNNIGYGGLPETGPTNLENPNLQWESALNFDAGFEFGLYKDRITGSVTYYNKKSSDVFLQIGVPGYYGQSVLYDNVAEILNEGVEFQITTRNLSRKLQWTTDFNIAYNYNEITSLGGYSEDAVSGGTNDTRTVVGYPVGTNYLVRFSHVDPETGAPVYFDKDGNETYKWDPDDRVPVGSVLPKAVGGINNTFRYESWDLSFLFVFTIGGNIYDSSSKRQLGRVDEWNKTELVYDRWTEPGDEATYPRLTLDESNHGSTTPWINTDLYLHDATYARLRNVTLAYNLPSKTVKKMKLTSMRIGFVGTNLLTFTKYPGIDPEIARDFENPTDRNMSPNISFLTPPQEKTYSLTLNVTF